MCLFEVFIKNLFTIGLNDFSFFDWLIELWWWQILIIDSHVHLFFEESDPEEFFMACARTESAIFGKETGEHPDPVELYSIQ